MAKAITAVLRTNCIGLTILLFFLAFPLISSAASNAVANRRAIKQLPTRSVEEILRRREGFDQVTKMISGMLYGRTRTARQLHQDCDRTLQKEVDELENWLNDRNKFPSKEAEQSTEKTTAYMRTQIAALKAQIDERMPPAEELKQPAAQSPTKSAAQLLKEHEDRQEGIDRKEQPDEEPLGRHERPRGNAAPPDNNSEPAENEAPQSINSPDETSKPLMSQPSSRRGIWFLTTVVVTGGISGIYWMAKKTKITRSRSKKEPAESNTKSPSQKHDLPNTA